MVRTWGPSWARARRGRLGELGELLRRGHIRARRASGVHATTTLLHRCKKLSGFREQRSFRRKRSTALAEITVCEGVLGAERLRSRRAPSRRGSATATHAFLAGKAARAVRFRR